MQFTHVRLAKVVAILFFACTLPVRAETVVVKYRGPVDLARMQCESVIRSSFIRRLCYDPRERYVVVALDETYYHYCDVPAGVVQDRKSVV